MKKLFTIVLLATATLTQANAQTITGGNMETWKSYSSFFTPLTRPDGWSTSDSVIRVLKFLTAPTSTFSGRVTKSTAVKHAGTASAKMVSGADSLPTLLTNGVIDIADLLAGDLSTKGGTNVTKRILFVKAWIQHTSASSADSGVMIISAIKNGAGSGGADSVVGTGGITFPGSASFVQITSSITYTNTTIVPDRIIVAFLSSSKAIPPTGTTLYVDDVTLTDPTGIETPLVNDANIRVFPNPATDKLHISTEIKEPMTIELFNNIGQIVLTQTIGNQADINVSGLAAGTYIYVIANAANGQKYYSATFSKQ